MTACDTELCYYYSICYARYVELSVVAEVTYKLCFAVWTCCCPLARDNTHAHIWILFSLTLNNEVFCLFFFYLCLSVSLSLSLFVEPGVVCIFRLPKIKSALLNVRFTLKKNHTALLLFDKSSFHAIRLIITI